MWINFHTYLPGKYINGEYSYHEPNLTLRALPVKKNASLVHFGDLPGSVC